MYNDENNYTAYNSEPQPQPQPQPQLTKKGLRAMRKACLLYTSPSPRDTR